jgi:hypothetical protein
VHCLYDARDWARNLPIIVHYMDHIQLMSKIMVLDAGGVISCDEYKCVLMSGNMNVYLNKFIHRLVHMLGNKILAVRRA